MSFFPPIDHIERRSSFSFPQTYSEFMEYAPQCRDELQVYLHMEENQIGIDQPDFWISLLQNLKQKCQFKLLIKKLTQLKQIKSLREYLFSLQRKHEFIEIIDFEYNLTRELELEIRRKKKTKRRSVRQFQLFSISKILKKTRKVGDGSFQIYVDQERRDNYKLNDLSEFILDQMKDYIDERIKQYEKKRAHRPLSFLGQKQQGLKIWSKELIEANKRNSQIVSFSEYINGRLSNQHGGKNKRISMTRKSTLNLENNPQKDLNKTPREKRKEETDTKSIRTPKRKMMSPMALNQNFTTPNIKNPTISRSINKAHGKFKQKGSQGDNKSEISEFKRELEKLEQGINFDVDILDFPSERQVIRDNSDDRENTELNIAHLDSDSSEESQQNECKESIVLNCLESTNNFESIDSNNENIFSNEKKLSQPVHNFRRRGAPLQIDIIGDPLEQNNLFGTDSGLSISQIEKIQTGSSGALEYQMMLDDIGEGMYRVNLNGHQNLVLETMRKKKIEEIIASEKRRENSHPNGIHTEIKPSTRLAHISEQHSYSERKHTTIKRFSDNFLSEDEDSHKK